MLPTPASTFYPPSSLGFLVEGVVVFLSNNLWEEGALMGFLQIRLQDRHGPMRAVLLTAIYFTFQHAALFVLQGSAALVTFPLFFVIALGFRALLGWTYNKTGSVFIVGLVHAASNAATGGSQLFGEPGFLPRLYQGEDFVSTTHLVAAFIVGVALVLATKGRLGLSQTEKQLSSA